MIWKLIRNIIAPWLLVVGGACYAATDDISQTLLKSYNHAMSSYNSGDIDGAYTQLSSFFEKHSYSDFDPSFPEDTYLKILNDYAFFMEKYYEEQADGFCKNKNATSKDFLIFRSSILDDATEILKFVIDLRPDRGPAYLNLADVLYELDSDEEANGYYAQYAVLQREKGRSIPKRVLDVSARKKFYRCK